MNSSIRKITFVLGVIFLALFANLNYVQIGRSDHLAKHPRNDRSFLEEIGRRRGEILAADGSVLAVSRPFTDERFRFRRRYPEGRLFGHITGHFTPDRFCRSQGLEDTFADVLIGDEPPLTETFVDELLGRERDGHTIRITIDPAAQRAARNALGGQRGSAAAIDPRSGAVLALYSNPTYNPNSITRLHPERCGDVKRNLDDDRDKPLLLRATQERYPPGSTFKIITAAAALQNGMSPSTTVPVRTRLDLPDSDRFLRNFGNGTCGGTMARALAVSCNTAFGEFGLRVGAEAFAETAGSFGFDRPLSFDLPTTQSCVVAIPGLGCDDAAELARPFVALSAIGQFNVRVTALQMARAAAAVANGGRLPEPYLVQQIQDAEGAVLQETEPQLRRRVYSRRTGRQLKQMLVDVVRSGTGAVVGFSEASRGIIGGKTGTAQTGVEGEPPHVWFVAFAPNVAVAVVVENGGDLRDAATGGRVAGPIAKAVLETIRRNR